MQKTHQYIQAISSLLIILLTYCSCERKASNLDNNGKPPIIRDDFLVIGDASNSFIIDFDTISIKWVPNQEDVFELDLDNDGIYDVELISDINDEKHGTWIKCRDSSTFLSIYQTYDTTLYNFHIDTSILEMGPNNDSVVVISHNYYTPSCRRYSPNDSIINIYMGDHLKILSEGDSIKMVDNWLFSNQMHFFRTNKFYDGDRISETLDTVVVWNARAIYDCYNFPTDLPVYIGVKLDKNNESRFAWIKLISNGTNIILLESGIQN